MKTMKQMIACFGALIVVPAVARDRGVCVSIMLFEGHSLQFSDSPWRWDGQVQTRQIGKLYKRWASWPGKADDKLK